MLARGTPEEARRLAALAAEKTTATSSVIVVDQYTGFDPAADTYDGAHPNLVGEEKMASSSRRHRDQR